MAIIANPEDDWRRFGELDPYYAVLSHSNLKKDELTEEHREDFFASGVAHMQACFDIASTVFNFHTGGQALDFGCGVGRLTNAMAPLFSEVVGVDISPGMLTEARRESEKRGLYNIIYDLSTEETRLSPNTYDFVHTYIVLQHIPPSKGEYIIKKMLASLKIHGVGAIHLTYDNSQGEIAARLREAIKNFLPLRAAGNLLRGNRWNYPTMQMNNYNLSSVLNIFSAQGINDIFICRTDDWGKIGLYLFFRKPEPAAAAASWSNPVRKTLGYV